MHIELTDHLRCPEAHEESFLVLLPDRMAGRQVVAGRLGCPVCGWHTSWDDGIPDFGGGRRSDDAGLPPFDADTLLTLLGVEGPGGWIALSGRAATLAAALAERLPEVGIVAINPPEGVEPSDAVSVVRALRWPLKEHAMRGVVVGRGGHLDPRAALRSALPGLRVVGEGAAPALGPRDTLLAETDSVWVASHR